MDTAASENNRPPGIAQTRRRARNRISSWSRTLCGNTQRFWIHKKIRPKIIVLPMSNILGHIEHNRSRSSRRGNSVRASHKLGNAIAALDPNKCFSRWRQNLRLTRLLRHILPRMLAIAIAHNNNKRNTRIQRLHQSRNQIRRPGAERTIAYSGTPSHARPGIGGKNTTPLIIDQRMRKPQLAHGIVKRQKLKPSHTEHRRRIVKAKHLSKRLSAIHVYN